MKSLDHSLEPVFRQIREGNCGMAIAELEVYLSAWPDGQTTDRLNVLKEEYELMAGYWRKGVDDPQRQEQYQRLLQQVYLIFANIAMYRRLQASSFLVAIHQSARKQVRNWSLSAIRHEMENFVSEIAMLEFEAENKRKEKSRALYKAHQQQVNMLFNYIVTSRMWTNSVGKGFTELLLSPTIDNIDQQLIVSAITISLMSQFDIVKFRLLTDVYRQATDEHVRQRALVGWVFSLDDTMSIVYPEQQTIVDDLLQSDAVCQELTELQMQLLLTLNAEKDNDIIRNEIMPDLMKNDAFQITRNGIEEVEEDPLEDVLHPDASERRMEQLEASMQRMIDMQKQGSDVYFGGFAQMKRYPFFYDMSNWLVPFYIDHPDIAQFVDRLEFQRFVRSILSKGPFCNSDKYSFVIASMEVLSRLPASIRDVIRNNEASLGELALGENQTSAYLRRIYLMDLYRFFRLFPNRAALNNPFEDSTQEYDTLNFFSYVFFAGTQLDAQKHSVVRMMKKYQFDKMAKNMLIAIPRRYRDAQYYIWAEQYENAVEVDPSNEQALSGAARHAFKNSEYDKANDYYDRLLLLFPGKKNYMLNKAVCLVRLEDYEEALKLLYELDYEYADDVNVQRVLAWTLTCDSRLEQAAAIYEQLMTGEKVIAEDHLNYGYCLWVMGRIDDAAEHFRKSNNPIDFPDIYWLSKRGIDKLQIRMMKTLIRS
jgi:tetratricopeptide (TPR) repeat protein